MISTIILCVAILYLWIMSFIMSTENFRSTMIFKFIPFLIGVGLLFVVVTRLGWLVTGLG